MTSGSNWAKANAARRRKAQERQEKALPAIKAAWDDGCCSFSEIARRLEARKIEALAGGARWCHSQVRCVLQKAQACSAPWAGEVLAALSSGAARRQRAQQKDEEILAAIERAVAGGCRTLSEIGRRLEEGGVKTPAGGSIWPYEAVDRALLRTPRGQSIRRALKGPSEKALRARRLDDTRRAIEKARTEGCRTDSEIARRLEEGGFKTAAASSRWDHSQVRRIEKGQPPAIQTGKRGREPKVARRVREQILSGAGEGRYTVEELKGRPRAKLEKEFGAGWSTVQSALKALSPERKAPEELRRRAQERSREYFLYFKAAWGDGSRTLAGIKRWLEERGIPTPNGRSHWQPSQVRMMLSRTREGARLLAAMRKRAPSSLRSAREATRRRVQENAVAVLPTAREALAAGCRTLAGIKRWAEAHQLKTPMGGSRWYLSWLRPALQRTPEGRSILGAMRKTPFTAPSLRKAHEATRRRGQENAIAILPAARDAHAAGCRGAREISRWFEAQGVKTPTGGSYWDPASLSRLLRRTSEGRSILESKPDQKATSTALQRSIATRRQRAQRKAEELFPYIEKAFAEGCLSLGEIGHRLEADGTRTPGGGLRWHPKTVDGVLLRAPGGQSIRRALQALSGTTRKRRAQQKAEEMLPCIDAARAAGCGNRSEIARQLEAWGVKAPAGGSRWYGHQVRRIEDGRLPAIPRGKRGPEPEKARRVLEKIQEALDSGDYTKEDLAGWPHESIREEFKCHPRTFLVALKSLTGAPDAGRSEHRSRP